MSPWTALLESLHSAMIDELTHRHPEPKPTLGMPLRQAQFAFPRSTLSKIIFSEVHFGDAKGTAIIAAEPEALKRLSTDVRGLWDAVFRRAGGEFMHRKISPRLMTISEWKSSEPLPALVQSAQRVIWIPFQLANDNCYLAIAV